MSDHPEVTEGSDAPDLALSIARVAVLMIGFAIVGAAASSIFDQRLWVLVVAPLPPSIAATVLLGRTALLRMLGAAAGIGLAVGIAVVSEGGDVAAFLDAFSSGPQGLLSTEWPSPLRPDLVGAVAALIATATAIADELAVRRRFHLLALFPLIVTYVVVVGLSAPNDVTWWPLVLLAVTATTFAALRPTGSLHDRLTLLRGEGRLVPLLGVAIVLVALMTIPVSLTARADPRRTDPPAQTAPLLDPIEASRALRNLDPAITLHVIENVGDDGPLPTEWRTAALDDYDGRRWTPDLTLRPIGRTLGEASESVVEANVSFLDDNLTLVPLPGPPVAIDVDVETDDDRTVVRLPRPPVPGTVVGLAANVSPTFEDATRTGLAPRLVDESTAGFSELARALAGEGTPLEQIAQLERTMQDDFVRDSNVQGGGLQLALIERFLRDTQRGTPEQFATGFVLLARSLGIEARVATGFRVDEPGEPLSLRSDDAAVWPEVQLLDGRWLALDPTPADEATDGEPAPPQPQVQTPAAPQPPIAPPPDPDNETIEDDETAATEEADTLATVLRWVGGAALAVGALLLPFAIAAAVIVGLKYRRRRRRLAAASPTERIRGAWATATDALVDAGLDIAPSSTDNEIATRGGAIVTDARRDLRRLAGMSSAATYGVPHHVDLLADDATACLLGIEESISAIRTNWQRWRWRLSLRSLRASTRSPVRV
jgi:transglutaminase-like putative cysteine protease